MVVKLGIWFRRFKIRFESSVIPYGSKTLRVLFAVSSLFESSVIPYGSKTIRRR